MKDFLTAGLGAFIGIELGFMFWEMFFNPFFNIVSKGIRRLFK